MRDEAFFDQEAGPPPLDDGTCPACGTPFDETGDCYCTLTYKLTPEEEQAMIAKCMLFVAAKVAEMTLLGEDA
mgnify:CR=1 FL=1